MIPGCDFSGTQLELILDATKGLNRFILLLGGIRSHRPIFQKPFRNCEKKILRDSQCGQKQSQSAVRSQLLVIIFYTLD